MYRLLGFGAVFILILTSLGCASAPPPRSATEACTQSLVGTWKLVDLWELDEEGKRIYRFGEHPRGYVIYDSTGHVFVGFMRNPPVPPDGFIEAPPSNDLKSQAWDAYGGYFGTYTVDWAANVVTHHVEGALNPRYVGSDERRPFTLTGDTFIIGDQKTWARIFVRVRSPFAAEAPSRAAKGEGGVV
jgi:hypothetical protein